MIIRDLVAVAASRFKAARIAEPRLEAEFLLAHLLKRDLAWLLAHTDAAIGSVEARAYAKLIAARARHVPFAQLVGEKWFYGRPFIVTKNVLVPRPETELLIEAVIFIVSSRAKRNEAERATTIVDIGTGSGAIGLTLAGELPNSKAVLYDISSKALAVARLNAKRLKLGRRVRFAKLDLLRRRLPEPNEPVILVANLPYLPLGTWKKAQPEVRLHEPKLALVSGQDGLDHYRALFKKLVQWKCKPDLVAFEAEPGQFKELISLAHESMPSARIEILKDLHGDERVMVIEKI